MSLNNGNDGDKFIEASRGELFRIPYQEVEDLDEENGHEAVEIQHMTGDDIDNIYPGLD